MNIKKMSKEEREKLEKRIIQLKTKYGLKTPQLAERFGLCHETIRRIIKKGEKTNIQAERR
ncbi:hypothetical protein [Thermodesulfovibrio sp.]|uniref:hypothetical protein n=1 Tax=Thermodesulfovibrio sp. TaxID=2067987 RepID=UPI0030EC4AAB